MNFRCVAVVLLVGLQVPALAQGSRESRPAAIPFSAVIETIEFKDVPAESRKLILDRIGVRVGDMLTIEARQRIGRELGKVHKGMTFTYKPGSASGTAKLVISLDC